MYVNASAQILGILTDSVYNKRSYFMYVLFLFFALSLPLSHVWFFLISHATIVIFHILLDSGYFYIYLASCTSSAEFLPLFVMLAELLVAIPFLEFIYFVHFGYTFDTS